LRTILSLKKLQSNGGKHACIENYNIMYKTEAQLGYKANIEEKRSHYFRQREPYWKGIKVLESTI
jgi:hypothetical protein